MSTQRRRPTIAKEWQLAVLKKLQSESGNPTEEQRSAAAAETGLDDKWVRNWFTRQRSKLAARNRKGLLATTSAAVPTFKLQLCFPPSGPISRRSASTPIDPPPSRPRQPSPALESRSPPPSQLALNNEGIPRSHRSVSAPVYSDNPPQRTTIPTYSRDPLCNRYPDFSQFFRPQGHERAHAFELCTPVDGHGHPMRLTAYPNTNSHMNFQDLSNLSNSAAFLPCPVAFSVRLADLLGCP